MNLKSLIAFLIIYPILDICYGQITIEGLISDQQNQPVVNASILIIGSTAGTTSDENGRFILTSPAPCQLSISHINYETLYFSIQESSKLNIQLQESSQNLEEVEISSGIAATFEKVDFSNTSHLTGIFGEKDITRYIVTLPGISNINSFDAGVSIRGGSTTDNAFLIDGIRIAEPKHISTLITAFDPFVLNEASVYKGGFPARYNGKLSGYIDMNSSRETEALNEAAVSLGMISSSANARVYFGKNKNQNLALSLRESYLTLVSEMYQKKEKVDEIPNYRLRDLTFSYSNQVNEHWNLSLTALSSADDLPIRLSSGEENQMNWHANSGILRSSRKFSNNSVLSISGGANTSQSSFEKESSNQKVKSSGSNYSALINWQSPFDKKVSVSTGYRFEHNTYRIDQNQNELNHSEQTNRLHSLYADLINFLSPDWSVTLGANATYFEGTSDLLNLAPRFKSQLYLGDYELWIDYARSYQYEEKLPFFTIRGPIDIPVPLGQNNHAASSDQSSIGVSWLSPSGITASVSPFYKYMQHVKDFSSQSRSNLDFSSIQMIEGEGEAYGVEISLGLNKKWITAMANYTYLKSIQHFDEINNGDVFSPPYDITSNVSVSAAFRLGAQWTFTAFWTYASGVYVTIPEGITVAKDLSNPNSIVNYIPVYGDRYNYRLPARHRLDLAMSYETNVTKSWLLKLTTGTYNTYNRQNADFVYLEVEQNDDYFVSFIPKSKMVLPFVPYLSVTLHYLQKK